MSLISAISKTALILSLCLGLSGCFKSAEERAAEHYENGLTLVEAGDLQRAIVEFRNTVQLYEDHLDAYRQLAAANQSLGRIGEAYGSYLALVERAPEDVDGRIALSELAFQGRNWEEFDRHGTKAAEFAPERPAVQAIDLGVRYRTARLDEKIAETAAIVVQAEALAEELPDNSIVRQIRLDSYIADAKYDDALVLLDESIVETPNNMALYTLRLELLSRLGKTETLEAELRNMLEVFPDEQGPKETYLRYLISRDRSEDAQNFLQELVTKATPEDRNSAYVTLLQFIQETKGANAVLAKADEILASDEPENGLLHTFRASLIFDMGQHDEGIVALEDVLSSETLILSTEDRQKAKTALARMLLVSGNEVGARKQVEEVLAADPNAPGALMMRANWSIADDETDAAIADLRSILDGSPTDANAMVLLAQAYERAGNRDLMLSFLSQAVEASNNAPRYALKYARALVADDKLLQAESTLISSLRIVPGNFEVLSLLGNVYLRLEDIPRAEQVAKTIAALDNPRAKNAANLLQTEILARRVGPDHALGFLEGLVAQDGDLASKLTLIQARVQAGQVQEAVSFAEDAVAQAPDNLQLRVALALTYAAARNYAAAEIELETVLKEQPNAVPLYLQLARLKGVKGDPAAGQAVIERGLAQVADAPDLLWAKASYLQNQGDIDGAISIYEALYARNSANLIIANNLASMLTTYRDDAQSLNRAELIARRLKDADMPAFQDTYGWILFRTGAVQEALAYLEPAAAGLPGDPMVQFHLGQAYGAAERLDDALAQMRKALEISGPLGDQDFRQRVESRIAELEAAPVVE